MKRRPWSIVVLAILYFIAPILNAYLSARLMRLNFSEYLELVFAQNSPGELFVIFGLLPLAAIAIFLMKKWSYFVFLLAMALVVYFNFREWQQHPDKINFGLLIFLVVFNIGLVSYFLIPAVKVVYFNPRVRWWESKPRYLTHINGEMEAQTGRTSCVILNLSEGGALVQYNFELPKDTEIDLSFSIFGEKFRIAARVQHSGPQGYGLKFNHGFHSRNQFRILMKKFRQAGYPERTEMVPWYQSFKAWLVKLFKTGRGLTPDLEEVPENILGSKGK